MGIEKERILIISIVSFILIAAATVFAVAQSYSKEYLVLAEKESSPDKRLEYLLKSDSLGPNNSKKLKIVSIYFKLNQLEQGKKFLMKLRGEDRAFYLRGYFAEVGGTRTKMARVSQIKNEGKNREIMIYKEFLEGKEIQGTGDSDYSAVIRYFSEDKVLENKESYSYLYTLINEVSQNRDFNNIEKKIFLAKNLVSICPELTERVLVDLEEGERTIVTYQLLTDAYFKQGKKEDALNAVRNALTLAPESSLLLSKAIELSDNPEDKEYYQKRLQLLESIDD